MDNVLRRVAVAAATIFCAPFAIAEMTVSFDGSAAIVTGATPNAEVVVLSVWREQFYGWARINRFSDVLVAAGDGVGRYEASRAVPAASLWIFADVANGEIVVATPGAQPYPSMRMPERQIVVQAGRVALLADSLELVLARPGVGAWSLSLWDGGLGDADSENDGRIDALVAEVSPLGGAPPAPGGLVRHDILLGIEPEKMEYLVVRFSPPGQ